MENPPDKVSKRPVGRPKGSKNRSDAGDKGKPRETKLAAATTTAGARAEQRSLTGAWVAFYLINKCDPLPLWNPYLYTNENCFYIWIRLINNSHDLLFQN